MRCAGRRRTCPRGCSTDALTVASAITDDRFRAWALRGLAPHLPEGLLTDALAAASAITDDQSRADALSGLAPHLPEPQRSQTFTDALTAASAITDDRFRAWALRGLAPHLPEGLLTDALAAASAITDDQSRADALNALGTVLGASALVGDEGEVRLLETLLTVARYDRTAVLDATAALGPWIAQILDQQVLAAIGQAIVDTSRCRWS